eukprot:c27887_g2_i1 orf=428-1765(+)
MTANFWRWEVDPFFAAAEDVQDSADRLESAYRTWIHTRCLVEAAPNDPDSVSSINFRRRELTTVLGTAKWQLEEFERAVKAAASIEQAYVGEDAPDRHDQFVEAIRTQIISIENSLLDTEDTVALKALPAVELDDKDKDDLAMFLSGSRPCESSVVKDMRAVPHLREQAKKKSPSTSSRSRENGGQLSSLSTLPTSSITNSCEVNEIRDRSDQSSCSTLACETKNLENHILYGCEPSGNLLNGSLLLCSEWGDNSVSRHLSEKDVGIRHHNDDDDGYKIVPLERAGTPGGGSGVSTSKVGNLLKTTKDKLTQSWQTDCAANGLWDLFSKKKRPADKLTVSKSGFKRWKDGDASSKDLCGIPYSPNLNGRSNDVELGAGTACLGNMRILNGFNLGSMLNCGEMRLYGLRGSFQWSPQHSHHSVPSSRPVQIASAILVALGFVGLYL